MRMKWTALLAVAVFMLSVGSATAAPKAIRGTVVAERAHGSTVVLATGRKGAAVTVHVAHRHSRLGDRLSPHEAGLPAGSRRRAPGLRREELATLAGVSVEYLVRLEQGRARHPSPQLLGALARALRLTDDERDHLYRLGGAAAPSDGLVSQHISPGVQRMLDRLGDVPIGVHSAAWDLLWWNPLWAALTGDPSARHGLERNVAWRHFMTASGAIDSTSTTTRSSPAIWSPICARQPADTRWT